MARRIVSTVSNALRVAIPILPMLLACNVFAAEQTETGPQSSSTLIQNGQAIFVRDCAFCHGRDAAGGGTGPDLTRSKLVEGDVAGDKIGPVTRNGRPEKGMPPFQLSQQQILQLASFIHYQKTKADSQQGGRRGVDAADLQTGNVEAGKKYFNGSGACSSCHAPTGDLAGVGKRYPPLELEERMLYPGQSRAYLNYAEEDERPRAPSTVTVTLSPDKIVTGKLSYHDEFTVALTDESGWYRSWPVSKVKYIIHAPAEAHVELLGKYTDDDIHNLMAYLQTLR